MTRKQFEALADALKHSTPLAKDGFAAMAAWRRTVCNVADVCAAQYRGSYGGFDRSKFLAACGIDDG